MDQGGYRWEGVCWVGGGGLRFAEEFLDWVGCKEAGCEDALVFLKALDFIWLVSGFGFRGFGLRCLLSARMEAISESSSSSSGSGDAGA
jgi:hypothetical protein